MSSAVSSFTVLGLRTVAKVASILWLNCDLYSCSMRIRVDHVIHTEAKILVRLVDHVEPGLLPRMLPALADVVLVVCNHHQSLTRIVALEVADEHRVAAVARDQVVQCADLEKRVKDRV